MLQGDGKAILTIFILVIIATTLIVSISDSVVLSTETIAIKNVTFTSAAAANGTTDLAKGRELADGSTYIVFHAVNCTAIPSTNVSLLKCTNSTSGDIHVCAKNGDEASAWSKAYGANYTYKPSGYLNESAARNVTILITIIAALAILVSMLVILIKSGTLGELMRKN